MGKHIALSVYIHKKDEIAKSYTYGISLSESIKSCLVAMKYGYTHEVIMSLSKSFIDSSSCRPSISPVTPNLVAE
jgi:hypothetical protein